MSETEAKKRFRGFTKWYNSRVRKEFRRRKDTLWRIYGGELMNTGTIELSSYETISGHPEIYQ